MAALLSRITVICGILFWDPAVSQCAKGPALLTLVQDQGAARAEVHVVPPGPEKAGAEETEGGGETLPIAMLALGVALLGSLATWALYVRPRRGALVEETAAGPPPAVESASWGGEERGQEALSEAFDEIIEQATIPAIEDPAAWGVPPEEPESTPEPTPLPPEPAPPPPPPPPQPGDSEDLDRRLRAHGDSLRAQLTQDLQQVEGRVQTAVLQSVFAELARSQAAVDEKLAGLSGLVERVQRSVDALSQVPGELVAVKTAQAELGAAAARADALEELDGQLRTELGTLTRGLAELRSQLDENSGWIAQRADDLETLRENRGVTDLPASRDPDWVRVQDLLDRRGGGRVLAKALAREVKSLDQDLELLMECAMALVGQRPLSDADLTTWCTGRSTPGEAQSIGRAHADLREIRVGVLSALKRVGAYFNSPEDRREAPEHPLGREEREALGQLFEDDGSGAIDRDELVQGVLRTLVTPMLSGSLYLTDACLAERWGRLDGREQAQHLLRALQRDLGRASPSMGDDFHLAGLLDVVMKKELHWSWIPARPYETSETEADQASRVQGQKPSINPLSMDSLTDAEGRQALGPSKLGQAMVARVDQPLLVANDGSDGIAPIYRVTRD